MPRHDPFKALEKARREADEAAAKVQDLSRQAAERAGQAMVDGLGFRGADEIASLISKRSNGKNEEELTEVLRAALEGAKRPSNGRASVSGRDEEQPAEVTA